MGYLSPKCICSTQGAGSECVCGGGGGQLFGHMRATLARPVGASRGRGRGGSVGYFNQCKEHIHFHLLVLKIVQLNVQCEWVNQLSVLAT